MEPSNVNANLLIASIVCATSLPAGQPNAEDCRARLAGTWRCNIVAAETIEMTIDADKIELAVVANGKKSVAWAGKLVLSETVPESHFDWRQRISANGPLDDNQCLYRLLGNTLLVIGGGPSERPTQFLSGNGDSPKTLIFTRIENGE